MPPKVAVNGFLPVRLTVTSQFLAELEQAVEPTKKIHLILDNSSSHTSTQTRQWLREHPRITVTYTPTHASWLNMVEIFFSILTRRMLRRGDFASRDDLAEKIIKLSRPTTARPSPSVGPTTPSSSRPHDPPTDLCGAALETD
jgi:transposase